MVENNKCFGSTSIKAISGLRKVAPNSKILYVGMFTDYTYQDMPGADVVFYGRLTNEARGLSTEEANTKGISNNLSLFPWENLDEEWRSVSLQKFEYQDKN